METGNIFEIMGTAGSLIMCASSVPQIMKTYRTKCADSLSGSYLAILMIGMLLILLYALYKKDVVFIFGNGISLLLTGMLVALWFRYKKNQKRESCTPLKRMIEFFAVLLLNQYRQDFKSKF
jgi:MtN3 and saliva related transmembrane protein